MNLRFWGVRGSTPTPSLDNFRYGGNTPCVEVRTPQGGIVILDCGSGLRLLGKQLLSEFGHQSIHAHIFLSHYHWDHIQGIPFFEPLYNPENSFTFNSFPSQARGVEQALDRQMSDPYFPVSLSTMQAQRHFQRIQNDALSVEDAVIKTAPLNHPQGCLGFRVECNGRAVVYATDNEPGSPEHDRNVRKLAEGADVFIYDAQYTPYEYANYRKGWGHSTWREAVNIAQESHVQQLILFHHEPDHSDSYVDSIVSETRKFFPNSLAAWEGLAIDLVLNEHAKPVDVTSRRIGNRQNLRVPLKVVGKRDDGTPFVEKTMLENVSMQGAYFLLENNPDPKDPLEVEFEIASDLLPGNVSRPIKSTLVRNQAVQLPNATKRGIAVMFQ